MVKGSGLEVVEVVFVVPRRAGETADVSSFIFSFWRTNLRVDVNMFSAWSIYFYPMQQFTSNPCNFSSFQDVSKILKPV